MRVSVDPLIHIQLQDYIASQRSIPHTRTPCVFGVIGSEHLNTMYLRTLFEVPAAPRQGLSRFVRTRCEQYEGTRHRLHDLLNSVSRLS